MLSANKYQVFGYTIHEGLINGKLVFFIQSEPKTAVCESLPEVLATIQRLEMEANHGMDSNSSFDRSHSS